MDAPTKQLFYFADPMCSWCWGFSPVIGHLAEAFGDRVPVEPVMGGLRPGTKDPLDEGSKAMIREHWEHVHEASGQPFDFGFFDREGFVYDTEPACRAVLAARRLDRASTLPFLKAVQKAFYAENRDVTNESVLVEVAGELGLDADVFFAELQSEGTVEATKANFALTKRLHVSGFPTLLAQDPEGLRVVTVGYRPLEVLEPALAAWVDAP